MCIAYQSGTESKPWDIYTNQIHENSINVSSWNKGSFNSVEESVARHFYKHADEVGASDIEQYIRKADGFKLNLKGATKSYVNGAVDGVIRYKKMESILIWHQMVQLFLLAQISSEVLHGRVEKCKN